MAATTITSASAYDVAIIGGGIAGCAAARSLTLHDPAHAKVTVYEIGRGPGGRASTRRTRSIPGLGLNHGAPYADICSLEGKELVRDLGLMEFRGMRGWVDSASGGFTSFEEEEDTRFVTGADNEMSNLASSLLASSTSNTPITTRYSSMIRSLSHIPSPTSPNGQRWQLHDKSGTTLGSADYLIIAGSGIAHPRWTDTFGGDPPLVAAAAKNKGNDAILDNALASIARQKSDPILAVFFYCTGDAATKWRELGFQIGKLRNTNNHDGPHEVLSKIIIQPHEEDGGCAVVLHSTAEFARANTGVFGSTSSAARVGDASSDSSREDILIAQMLQALSAIPGYPTVDTTMTADGASYGPLLHRWGNAFPVGDPLARDLTVCPISRVGFCGDYTETEARMGSVEAALLSGTSIGERIARLAKRDRDGGAEDGMDG
eukprot:CAMPEP_0198258676 /NCGR_PEP_ID=MMETSP1447-20131203/8030_1 /TAXON_ID=420782 /ORGANISM="Chaetoceros dichaeta, Strain CCMP1751" /LENGTH=431 /DNA_ID=CAMNT_0043945845 /DNA_START=44 /DNA_END=1339 /DNA_ORIENTATION=-